jgi:hypothetical protein
MRPLPAKAGLISANSIAHKHLRESDGSHPPK